MNATLRFGELPKDYADLCRVFPPRPIRDGVDYANAPAKLMESRRFGGLVQVPPSPAEATR